MAYLYNPLTGTLNRPSTGGSTPLPGGGLSRGTTLGGGTVLTRRQRDGKLARLKQQLEMQQKLKNRRNVPYHTHNIETGGPNQKFQTKPMPPIKRPLFQSQPRPNIQMPNNPYQSQPRPNIQMSPTSNLYSNASGGGCSLWMCGE